MSTQLHIVVGLIAVALAFEDHARELSHHRDGNARSQDEDKE